MVFLRGLMLGVLLLLGAAGLAVTRRHLLPFGVGVLLLVVPVAVLDFDRRYVLPVLPLACLTAAIAISGIARRHAKIRMDRVGACSGRSRSPAT